MTYVIAQPCVDLKDRACVDECPVDCIYEGKRMLYIHPDECVDCGACEPVCPVEAIYYEDDTPEEWKDYYEANVHFFDDLGSPGGAAKMGEIDKDHPMIAALPPQAAGLTTRPSPPGSRTSPGTSSRRTPRRRARTPTASSTSRSARPSTRPPRSCSRRCGTPPTRRATRSRSVCPRPGRPASTGSRATTGSPGSASTACSRSIGSKELIASLPLHLGIGPGDLVVYPELAYPTYEVGATLAGADVLATDSLTAIGPRTPRCSG